MATSVTDVTKRSEPVQHPVQSHGQTRRVVPAGYFRISPWISWCLGLLLATPALPIIAFAVIVIRLTSSGPGIFRQVRVGRNGKQYMMYKLRTMRIDAEAKSGAVWAQPGDPRITRLGCILRKLHIDELPQLLNVLKGEMALIGPRPERPEFVEKLAPVVPGYLERLTVLPGVTGLAQINLPPDTSLDSVCDKLVLDLEYIERGGAWMDFRIYVCTLLRIFGIRGTLPARALGLWCVTRIPQLRGRQARSLGLASTAPRAHDEVIASNNTSGPAPATGSAHSHAGVDDCSDSNGRGTGNGTAHHNGSRESRHAQHVPRHAK